MMDVFRDAPAGLDGNYVACAQRRARVVDKEVSGTVEMLLRRVLAMYWEGQNNGVVLAWFQSRFGGNEKERASLETYFSNVVVPLLGADADFYCFLHEAG